MPGPAVEVGPPRPGPAAPGVMSMARGLDILDLPRVLLLLGDYGSGKTEVSVNLALRLAAAAAGEGAAGGQVAIADLDLVNPYFRCREAIAPLQRAGVRVVVPEGGHRFADLPILLPAVKGLLQASAGRAVLDVGGDEAGTRVLAAMAPAIDPARHGLWFVTNTCRPFNDTAEGICRTVRRIQGATGLRVSGLVSNTHLMEHTTAELVQQGAALSEAAATQLGVKLHLVAVMQQVAAGLDPARLPCPLLVMQRQMVPPWLRRPQDAAAGPDRPRPGAAGGS